MNNTNTQAVREAAGRRFVSFDVLRVLSCIVIVFYHFLMSLYANGFRSLDDVRGLYSTRNLNFVTVAVGIFFIISGAGLMASQQNRKFQCSTFFKKRFKSILIPYYIAFFIYVVWFRFYFGHGARAQLFGTTKTLRLIFTILGMDGYISQYGVQTFYCGIGEWFIGAILIAYAFFPILKAGLQKNRWLTFGVMTTCFALLAYFYEKIPVFSMVPPYTNAVMKLYEFFLGMFFVTEVSGSDDEKNVFLRGLKGNIFSAKYKFIYSILAFPVIIYYIKYPSWLPYNYRIAAVRILVQNLAFFLFIVGLEDLLKRIGFMKKPLSFLGKYTYYVFLVHHVVINLVTPKIAPLITIDKSIAPLFLIEVMVILAATAILAVAVFCFDWMLGKLSKLIKRK